MRLRPSTPLKTILRQQLRRHSTKPTPPKMSTPHYTSWTQTDLISRITHLESQLHQQNTRHSSPSPKRKPSKPKKSFDPSKYHTRLIALKFAYLGGKYNGFEHHANNITPLPTIEEELWKALVKTRLIFPKWKEGMSEEEVCWDGCEYSKCGRTDRGVSAFGQVVGVRVRSARPKRKDKVVRAEEDVVPEDEEAEPEKEWDDVRDELPYIQLINRVLPPDIRVLAWCPHPPENFSARFNCRERRYRYFFTNPAFMPLPGNFSSPSSTGNEAVPAEGWLDIEAMQEAAKKYEGLHDFRNLCKVDPSKQITNFERRIFHAGIHQVPQANDTSGEGVVAPKLYYFEVRGSAFLWHQVRHLVAVLFLVGQGYEQTSIVDDLLDVQKTPARPVYEMASDVPLVLWDCIFPDPEKTAAADHANTGEGVPTVSYEEGLDWVCVGDERGGRDQSKRATTAVEDGKYGRNGVMDELWALWRRRKMDEVLAKSLMEVVARQGQRPPTDASLAPRPEGRSDRLFDGSETPRTVGDYVPLAKREHAEPPDVVNERYRIRKGLNGISKGSQDVDMDE